MWVKRDNWIYKLETFANVHLGSCGYITAFYPNDDVDKNDYEVTLYSGKDDDLSSKVFDKFCQAIAEGKTFFDFNEAEKECL